MYAEQRHMGMEDHSFCIAAVKQALQERILVGHHYQQVSFVFFYKGIYLIGQIISGREIKGVAYIIE